jgi:hypothetical protein
MISQLSPTSVKQLLRFLLLFALVPILPMLVVSVASGATLTVTTLADSGAGSLRGIIATASSGDTINFSVGGTITLTGGELAIDKNLSLIGPGAGSLTISGNDASRIFQIKGNALSQITNTISGLTLREGNGSGSAGNTLGGAIYSFGAVLTLAGCNFSSNRAALYGGGLYAELGSVRLTDCAFSTNTAYTGGGVFAVSNTVALNQGAFTGNSATGFDAYGGGIYSQFSTVEITDGTFSGNSASGGGNFGSGGGICTVRGSVTLTNSLLTGNLAKAAGGGICTLYPDDTVTLTQCNITGNSAGQGGGISFGGVVTMTRCTVSGNSANYGGGLFGQFMSLTESTVSGNSAVVEGGGVFCTLAELIQCTVSGNTSTTGNGGGIYSYSLIELTQCTVSGNAATNGVGGGILTDTLLMLESTVSGNNAAQGGGIFASSLTLANSIIANSTGTNASGFLLPTLSGTNIVDDSSVTGAGVLNTNPLLGPLANNGGPTLTLALLAGSPAINAGDNSVAIGLTNDQRGAGFPRVALGSVDIGAYEFQGMPPGITSASNVTIQVSVAGSFPVTATGSPAPTISATGTLPNGVMFTNGILGGTPAGGTIGIYPLIITASNGASPNAMQYFTIIVTEAPGLIVTTTNDVVNPLDGQTSLREAIAYAATLSGTQTISFSSNTVNGAVNFYAGTVKIIKLVSGQLVISNNLNVLGSGATNLIISGNNSNRVLYVGPFNTVGISALSIIKGRSDEGGGIYNKWSNLVLSNCVLNGNSGSSQGGGIFVYGGDLFLMNCVISSNSVGGSGSGGGIYTIGGHLGIINSTINNNSAYSGGGILVYAAAAGITNSTICLNSAYQGGGIYNYNYSYFAALTSINNTFSDNSAFYLGGSIYNQAGSQSIFLGNTILQSSSGANLENFYNSDAIVSLGHNLCSDDGHGFLNQAGDLTNTIPQLGPLANNGGPTLTLALLAGSPAINAGDNSVAIGLTNDQRGAGFPRMKGPRVDIGAFEVQTVPPVAGNVTIYRYPTQSTKLPLYLVTSYSYDPDGNYPLGLVSFGPAASGQATVTRNGGYVLYLPAPGFTNVDSFTFVISNSIGQTATGTVNVQLISDNAQSQNITSIAQEPALGGGLQTRVSFAGIPGRSYTIQSTEILAPATWQTRTNLNADTLGRFDFVDLPPLPPQRFYRTIQTD